ncbi:PAS domain-containing protein [Seohaeicola nanhaiensis]|uniref:PAS domain-containing protein n=1 Tax=Seohaeicola nanhaiensis TaxID=1387282 RepID=A0ABV9KCT1_9RHOB
MEDIAGPPTENGASIAVQIVLSAPFPMVLTDPRLEDNPIVFVNRAFEKATGYSAAQAIGRNCRFLQSAKTDPKTVQRIRDGIAKGEEVSADILNCREDGSPFWNRLLIAPLRNEQGEVQYFFGVQKVLGEPPEAEADEKLNFMLREIQHRVKNHLMMVVGLIRLHSREDVPAEAFEKLARRVETLQLLYEELNASGGENRDAVALGGYLSRIVNSLSELGGGGSLLVDLDIDSFTVPLEVAVNCGLIISEATTNAMQHAFVGREAGHIRLSVHENNAGDMRVELADDGVGMPKDAEWPNNSSLGGRIIQQLAKSMDGTLRMASGPRGSVVTLRIPRIKRD